LLVLDCDPGRSTRRTSTLRIRKGVARNGVRLAVASHAPAALDPYAEAVLRYAPGTGQALLGRPSTAAIGG
jgi:NADH-quinone oxidoreductase subunit G